MNPNHPAHSELRNILDIIRMTSASHSERFQSSDDSKPLLQKSSIKRKRSYDNCDVTSTNFSNEQKTKLLHGPQSLQHHTVILKQPPPNATIMNISMRKGSFVTPTLHVPQPSTSSQHVQCAQSSQSLQSSQPIIIIRKHPRVDLTANTANQAANHVMVQIPRSPSIPKHARPSIGSLIASSASCQLRNSDTDNTELLQNIPYKEMINFLRNEFDKDERLQKDLLHIVLKK